MAASIILFCFFLFPLLSSAIRPIIVITPRSWSWSRSRSVCSRHPYCGENGERVYHPFWLIGQQPERCGYLGFNLHCGNHSTMLIDLPKSNEFAVRKINYHSQTIQIYDPLNCLPARLLTLDLSSSPFSYTHMQNYTLLTCPNNESLSSSNFTTIGCLGNSTFSTLATNASTGMVRSILGGNHTSCQILGVLQVPEQRYDRKGPE